MSESQRPEGSLCIVFDGPPSPGGPRFIEVETPDGKSVNAGGWRERPDGYWELAIPGRAANLIGAAEVEVVSEWLRMVAVCTLEGGIIRRPPISQTEIDAIQALLSSVRNG